MLYQADITIPITATKANPTTEVLKIAHGIITKFIVRIPYGHKALAHLVILHHEHQIAPSTENMDLHGDGFPIDWEDHYESYQRPHELKLVGWNDDDTYSHTFTVYVAVLPRKAIVAYAVSDAIKAVLGMLSPKRIFSRSD